MIMIDQLQLQLQPGRVKDENREIQAAPDSSSVPWQRQQQQRVLCHPLSRGAMDRTLICGRNSFIDSRLRRRPPDCGSSPGAHSHCSSLQKLPSSSSSSPPSS
eukprot:CAMPEP_0171577632 /NCGR_PEP_ID=MMETSP0961-20121227/7350_1 /TAXON_ID=87120 /ORGANISM="Aurantiochytrium limacinum, Strain ATCCMYA-1381" /LENGTH=102 /DNA_ID=CAMNT_0012133739 /DNA_START=259 /DNA_END=565 /DNA_ORIENTATION=+